MYTVNQRWCLQPELFWYLGISTTKLVGTLFIFVCLLPYGRPAHSRCSTLSPKEQQSKNCHSLIEQWNTIVTVQAQHHIQLIQFLRSIKYNYGVSCETLHKLSRPQRSMKQNCHEPCAVSNKTTRPPTWYCIKLSQPLCGIK